MPHPSPPVPLIRKTTVVGFRKAAEEMWGRAGLQLISSLVSDDTRRLTLAPVVIADAWVPEACVMDWYEAVYFGPAEEKLSVFRTFIDRMMDHGFGAVQTYLLSIATPDLLLARTPGLWTHDHNTGTLTVSRTETGATLVLANHIYITTGRGRDAVAEVYRYAGSLSRVKNITMQYDRRSPAELEVRLTWR